MTSSVRSLMRRLGALALAVGLLPAASGGAACVAHWVGGDSHGAMEAAQGASEAAPSEHAAHAHMTHEHGAPEQMAHAQLAHAHSPDDAPASHDDKAPCTALAACGVLAAVESSPRPQLPDAPMVAVLGGEHLVPPGPAPAPDVPPPRG